MEDVWPDVDCEKHLSSVFAICVKKLAINLANKMWHPLKTQDPEAQGTVSQGTDISKGSIKRPSPTSSEPDHTQKTVDTFDTQEAEKNLRVEPAQLGNSYSQNEQLIQPSTPNPQVHMEELQSTPMGPSDYRLE